MSPQSQAEMEAELAELTAVDPDKMAEYAENYVRLKNLTEACDTQKKAAYKLLLEKMEEQGLAGLRAAGANVSLKTIKTWGISQGDSPEDQLANIQAARDWYNEILPAVPYVGRPTVAMLKTAWQTLTEDTPDAPQPDFLIENERSQLSVRKA